MHVPSFLCPFVRPSLRLRGAEIVSAISGTQRRSVETEASSSTSVYIHMRTQGETFYLIAIKRQ